MSAIEYLRSCLTEADKSYLTLAWALLACLPYLSRTKQKG